jgi:predicted TIM-barrel fold metal-dependent hydrolase
MIIDSHVHAGWSDTLRHSYDTFEDIGVSLRRMDECGIDKAVILPIGDDGFERHNRETADIVARDPGRLVGYAKVSQKQDAGRVEPMLREAFEKLGLAGLLLHGHPTREIMEVMDHYRKPILTDVFGEVYPLRYVAEQYPAVPIIIAHMGEFLSINGQVRQTTLWLARTCTNIYFDTSSVCDHEWLERAVTEGLAHKMIFGSDGPDLHCGVELARVKYLKLPAEQEAMVLGGTIARLLGMQDGPFTTMP